MKTIARFVTNLLRSYYRKRMDYAFDQIEKYAGDKTESGQRNFLKYGDMFANSANACVRLPIY